MGIKASDFQTRLDGLKMTLDCDHETEADLRSMLQEASADGIIRFGIHTQS
ncbi:MAG: DUF3095 family protein, partial [Pseudomonadota bacterium]